MAQEQNRPPSRIALWARRLEILFFFFGALLLAAYVVRERIFVAHELSRVGIFAYPLAILLFAIIASAPFSVTDALAVMNGVLFGPVGGTVINTLGIVAAAVVGYGIARRTCVALDIDRRTASLPAWVRRYRVGSFPFLLAVRILPGIGGTIATQIAAALRVPIFIHIAAMATIAVPICTVLAIGGDRLADAFEQRVTEPVRHYVATHHPRFGFPFSAKMLHLRLHHKHPLHDGGTP